MKIPVHSFSPTPTSLPPPSQTPSLHLTWPRPPLPSSQVASPENFWWLCAALGVRHLLTARPAPAYCHRPNYLPSSAAAAFHQMCNPLYTTVSKQQAEANPPLAKPDLPGLCATLSRSLYYICSNQFVCSDNYILQTGQVHFANWTSTLCKGRSTCPPLSALSTAALFFNQCTWASLHRFHGIWAFFANLPTF